MSNIVWQPNLSQIKDSQITKFIEFISNKVQLKIADSDELYTWSVNNSAQFWELFWQFSQIKSSQMFSQVLVNGDNMLDAKWFVGAKLNYAENLLWRNDDQLAIIFRGEDQLELSYTFSEMRRIVANLAASLTKLGVVSGNRVAGYLPNLPHTVFAMLATASLGAIWSSCSPDFGVAGALDRFEQITPKVLFTVDGYYYNGKIIDCRDKVVAISEQLTSLTKVVMVKYVGLPELDHVSKLVMWDNFCTSNVTEELSFTQLDFNHPLFIMYSSGTTGVPKAIVHSAGGTLIQHLKEHQLHTDLKANDRVFYYTTCGWMMWNWLVSGLASGATLVLYDGSPTYPDSSVLWKYAADYNINIFGTSAKYLSALEKADYQPIQHYALPSLDTILSTGSPLLAESYDFVYQYIKSGVKLFSISGGTDIISCFALGNPTKPIYRGQIQQRGFGLKVEIYTDEGKSALINEKGELVCTKAFPSQPIYFWNDPERSKYKKAYFERFPNIWCHGDYAALTPELGIIIYGRSDTTLKPGGVRIGTAEIYRQVETIAEISDAVVIGQSWAGDVRVILFVKMRDGYQLTEELQQRIKEKIKLGASPRHVPSKIIQVADIPRTINGKIAELAVKNVVDGEVVKNKDALVNPEALSLFANLPQLKL